MGGVVVLLRVIVSPITGALFIGAQLGPEGYSIL